MARLAAPPYLFVGSSIVLGICLQIKLKETVSQIVSALGKRPLSTTSFPHAYAARGGAPPAIDQTISVSRNIRRCLTRATSHSTVDATVLPTSSELHVDTTSRIFD